MRPSALVNFFLLVAAASASNMGTKDNDINTSKTNRNHMVDENSVETSTDGKFLVYEPAPCQMIYSKYGCCWDGKSIPKGPNGEGCPVCKDHRHMKCKKWKPLCSGRLVKEMCPETCGVCGSVYNTLSSIKEKCKDEGIWRKLCPTYRRLGFCKQADIAQHCKRSCDGCS